MKPSDEDQKVHFEFKEHTVVRIALYLQRVFYKPILKQYTKDLKRYFFRKYKMNWCVLWMPHLSPLQTLAGKTAFC